MMPGSKGKGKGKAVHPSEQSPLLASSSHASAIDTYERLEDTRRRSPIFSHRVRSILLIILIVLVSLLVSAILFLALLAYSFRPSPSELSMLPQTAFQYTVPEEVRILNVTEDGVFFNVTMRCGIDADQILGVQGFASDVEKAAGAQRGMRGVGADWWEELRRWTAHKALARLPVQAIAVHIPQGMHIFPHNFTSPPLLKVSLQSPLLVPFITDVPLSSPPDRTDWLQPVSFTAIVKPVASAGQLWEFAQYAWAEGRARFAIGVSIVEAELPGKGAWWAKYSKGMKEDIVMEIQMPGE